MIIMRFVVLLKERPMLEDVGVQIPGVGRFVRQQRAAESTSSTSRPYFSLATFFATSATSCSAPLITPTLMCFASLPFWSQPTSARPASITAAAARKRNLILFTLSVLTVIVFRAKL